LGLLDEVISAFDTQSRKGLAQSSIPLQFKWKEIDKTADRTLLAKLQKYKVINAGDICDRNKRANLADVLSKYLSLTLKTKAKNGHKYKLLILLRHGEGMHNYAKWELFGPDEWNANQSTDLKWKDPELTQTGVAQAKALLDELKCLQSYLQLVISSPLKRALQTASYAVLPFLQQPPKQNDDHKHTHKVPIIVLEYTRERVNRHACDSRNDFSVIQSEWKEFDFEYEAFETNQDNQWNGKEDERRESLWSRSAKFMDCVWSRDEDVILYSGHCDFIMSLMEVIVDMPFYKPPNAFFFPIIITTV